MTDPADTYIVRTPQLLKEFDSYVKYVRPVLARYFDPKEVDPIILEARREYEKLIPQLPYIGGQKTLTQFLIYTALWLAVYRTMQAHGLSLQQTGELVYEICRGFLQAYPAFLTRMLGGMNFSRIYLRRLKKRAAESHQRKYPEGYVFDYVQGDGKTFDYGVDYLECASCKFLAKQGAAELAPYLCPVDILYSEALGWGLTRTRTLAEGADRCDFRFKRGGETNVAVPEEMREVIHKQQHI